MNLRGLLLVVLLCLYTTLPGANDTPPVIRRVTTMVPFPRGLAEVDGRLLVLSRGRTRGAGGVSAEVDDQAGTLFEIDPDVAEPWSPAPASDAIRNNGHPFALPTAPPFRPWDRTANPPTHDRETDRPYCVLRYHAPSRNLFICAFSGIDKAKSPGGRSFSKNLSDGVLRYDMRSSKWLEVERHDIEAGGSYPHHDPSLRPPPHGWLNGPDNVLPIGNKLFAVAKDNSALVRYDLESIMADPAAPPPPSEFILGETIEMADGTDQYFFGHSALAHRNGWLYIAFRTSGEVVRVPVDAEGKLGNPFKGELIARFDPYSSETGKTADITDMAFDAQGRLYVLSAEPTAIHRLRPDPANPLDARGNRGLAWLDLAARLENPKLKCENLFVDSRNRLFVTSGDGYGTVTGLLGAVYRIDELD